jgi:hypothetical protein
MKKICLLVFLFISQSKADSLNLSVMGITMHAISPGAYGIQDREKRKIDSDGRFAQNPEINLTYTQENQWFYNATILKDCFDNTGYFLGAGKQFEWSENLYWSLAFGVYARKLMPTILFEYGVDSGDYNYAPTPWLGFKKVFPMGSTWGFSVQANTNYFLTHASVGLEVEIP